MRAKTIKEVAIYYAGPDAKVGWVSGWRRDEHCGEIKSVNLTLNYQDAHRFDKMSAAYSDLYAKLMSSPGSFHVFAW